MRHVPTLTTLSLAALLAAAPEAQAKRKKKDLLLDAIMSQVDAALVSPPRDEEACFSPDEPCDVKLAKFVASAQSSIDVAVFDINLDQVVHQLLVKAKTIPVRIVVDKRQAKGPHSLVPTLVKGGARIRFGRQRGLMHNKFVIVDGKRLELGSFNFTHHAFKANQENQLYLGTPAVVARYKERFERIWADARPASLN